MLPLDPKYLVSLTLAGTTKKKGRGVVLSFSLAICTQREWGGGVSLVLICHIPPFLYNVLGKKCSLGKNGNPATCITSPKGGEQPQFHLVSKIFMVLITFHNLHFYSRPLWFLFISFCCCSLPCQHHEVTPTDACRL